MLQMLFSVAGIYVCFLTWGILQERVTTTPYEKDGKIHKFKFFIVLNLAQALISTLVSLLYLKFKKLRFSSISYDLSFKFLGLAAVSTVASPFGYASLKYINYPTMILGKSGKLIPVMLMNILLYNKKFPPSKYLAVFLMTAGVSLFTFMNDSKKNSQKTDSNIPTIQKLYGIMLLTINLALDGITSSTQDQIFHTYKTLSGTHMMVYMNFFQSILMGLYLLNPYSELYRAFEFIQVHPGVLLDMVLFGSCGALGQLFIFHTIEKFGAMFLTSVTVTRKMGSILLSVFLFGHSLVIWQWAGVGLVFGGIAVEAYFKGNSHKKSEVVFDKKSEKNDKSD